MKTIGNILLRAVIVFAVMAVLQYLIIYYLLAGAGIVAGIFLLTTSNDRPLAIGVLIGSVAFAIFAYVMSLYFPIQ